MYRSNTSKRFVNRIGIDRRQTAIAGSIIRLGESLEMTVVAEGIETADQLAQLLALGCEYGQGFYLARPAPAEELDPMIASTETMPAAGNDNGRTRSRADRGVAAG